MYGQVRFGLGPCADDDDNNPVWPHGLWAPSSGARDVFLAPVGVCSNTMQYIHIKQHTPNTRCTDACRTSHMESPWLQGTSSPCRPVWHLDHSSLTTHPSSPQTKIDRLTRETLSQLILFILFNFSLFCINQLPEQQTAVHVVGCLAYGKKAEIGCSRQKGKGSNWL
jgi:hypothetical protein